MCIRPSRLSIALALLAPAAAASPGDVVQNGSVPAILNANGPARQLTVVDLDGDGRMDLVRSRSQVNLWRQVEGGRLTPVAAVQPGGTAVVMDLDGDGALSIVRIGLTAVYGSEFSAPFVLGPSVELVGQNDGGGQACALAADFDGDGHPDLLADRNNTLRLWRGDGSGGLLPSIQAADIGSTATEAGDLDLDGTLDVLAGNGSNAVPLLGQGDGTFVAQAPIAMPGLVNQIALGHLDGDGQLDAAAATFGGLQLLLGTSGGGFTPWVSTTEQARAVALGDTDGDGDDDVAESLIGSVDVHLVDAAGLAATRSFVTAGSTSPAVVIAHLDGKAAATVVASSAGGGAAYAGLVLVDCAADGLPALEQTFPQVGQSLALADVDGDGHKDLVTWQQATEEIVVHAIPGNGTIGPASAGTQLATTSIPGLHVLHLDGDANEDLLAEVNTSTGAVWIPMRSNGDGTFTQGPSIPVPTLSNSSQALADVDGDGDLDLLFISATPVWYPNLGDGSFGPPLAVTIPQPFQPQASFVTGDVNEDGLADILNGTQGSEGVVREWLGLGNGSFASPGSITAGPYGTSHLLADDVDGDGHVDLLALGTEADVFPPFGFLTVLHGHGDASFTLVGHFPIEDFLDGNSPSTVDFNHNGRKDVLAVQGSIDRLALLPQAADGTFGAPQPLTFHTDQSSLLTADVDGDGHEDCLASTGPDPTTGDVALRVGWTTVADGALNLGHGWAGSAGLPVLSGGGTLRPTELAFVHLQAAPASTPVLLMLGLQTAYVPVAVSGLGFPPQIVPQPQLVLGLSSDSNGSLGLQARWPADAPPGLAIYLQAWGQDPLTGQPFASNALQFEGD